MPGMNGNHFNISSDSHDISVDSQNISTESHSTGVDSHNMSSHSTGMDSNDISTDNKDVIADNNDGNSKGSHISHVNGKSDTSSQDADVSGSDISEPGEFFDELIRKSADN